MPFAELVAAELARARQKHSDMNSAHEAYAVILEELDEFWEMVKTDDHKFSDGQDRMVAELVQIAAMCQRAAEDVFPHKVLV
ncbi:MAG: hypothetical protein ACE15C_20025 [Phycisphaerae bacterium]